MRILHVTPQYYPTLGGAELHIKEVSERLAQRGHEVSVLTLNEVSRADLARDPRPRTSTAETINGVSIVRLAPDRTWGPAFQRLVGRKGGWRSASAVFGTQGTAMLMKCPPVFHAIPEILRRRPDLVASTNWGWPAAYYVHLARKWRPFTLAAFPHLHFEHHWVKGTLYDRMLAACDGVVVNTSYEGDAVLRRGARHVTVGGVGIDPTRLGERHGREIRSRYGLADAPVVGFVGRIEPEKGAVLLLEAMRRVWTWNADARLVLAGYSLSPAASTLIASLTAEERARIVHIDRFDDRDKMSLFDAFDVYAMPSTIDSFGIVYLEAWMCRKPVIGARVGQTQCVIDDGVDGLLVDPRDPEEAALAIVRLLSDPALRDRMGARGRDKTLARHTWHRVTDRIEQLYLELDAARRHRRRSGVSGLAEPSRRQALARQP